MRRLCFFLCLTCLTFASGSAFAQAVGDKIVVSVDFETKIYNDKVDKVFAGSIHTIIEINDPWCAVADVKGWLPIQYTLSLPEALEAHTKRIAVDDEDVQAHATRGMIYLELGQPDKAFYDLNRALQLRPKNPSFWNNRGRILMAQGKLELAVSDITQAVVLSPKFDGAFANRGLCYMALGDNEKALADFQQAVALAPDDPWHLIKRGTAQTKLDSAQAALADFNAAIRIRSSLAEAYLGRANVYLGRNDLNQAERNAAEAIRLSPKSAEAFNNRGWIRYKAGDLEKSLEDFDRAIELDPQFDVAHSNRGVVYLDLLRYDQAISGFDAAIKLDGTSAIAFANRATARMGKGDFAEAQSDFDQALQLSPDLTDALNAKAWFLATCPEEEFRDGAQAVTLAEKACELSKWLDWGCLDTLAAAHAESGDFENAITRQSQAMDLAPEGKQSEFQTRLGLYESSKPYRSRVGKHGN